MTKNKKETLDEFIKRGGKINKIAPTIVKSEETHSVRVNPQFTHHQLSLADGEFFFGESRAQPIKKKTVSSKDFTSALEASSLPKHVIESIKKSIAEKKNE